jgi:hypothetical protein
VYVARFLLFVARKENTLCISAAADHASGVQGDEGVLRMFGSARTQFMSRNVWWFSGGCTF